MLVTLDVTWYNTCIKEIQFDIEDYQVDGVYSFKSSTHINKMLPESVDFVNLK